MPKQKKQEDSAIKRIFLFLFTDIMSFFANLQNLRQFFRHAQKFLNILL